MICNSERIDKRGKLINKQEHTRENSNKDIRKIAPQKISPYQHSPYESSPWKFTPEKIAPWENYPQ